MYILPSLKIWYTEIRGLVINLAKGEGTTLNWLFFCEQQQMYQKCQKQIQNYNQVKITCVSKDFRNFHKRSLLSLAIDKQTSFQDLQDGCHFSLIENLKSFRINIPHIISPSPVLQNKSSEITFFSFLSFSQGSQILKTLKLSCILLVKE